MLVEARHTRAPDSPPRGAARPAHVAAAIGIGFSRGLKDAKGVVLPVVASLVAASSLLAYPQSVALGSHTLASLGGGTVALAFAALAADAWPRLARCALVIAALATLWALHEPLHFAPAYLGREAPLHDSTLAWLDALLGFDWPAYFAWHAARPRLWYLGAFAYASTVPVGVALALWLAWRDDVQRLGMLLTAATLALLAIYVAVTLVPAHGTYAWFRVKPDDHAGLPVMFGAFQQEAFDRVRSGSADLYAGTMPVGIISFPSFHAVTCALYTWATWRTGLRWPMLLWQVLVLTATPVQGAHYGVDIAAGLAVAVASLIASWALLHRAPLGLAARAAGALIPLGRAMGNSVSGVRRGLVRERALRQEGILLVVSVPLAVWMAPTWTGRAVLICAVLGVIVVELLNTALENLCDRVTVEHDEAVGFVKDLGSAAVLVSLFAAALVWMAFGVDAASSGP